MPCMQYIKLKTKNEYGTKYGYVPCGKCVDCRKKMQNSWKFRLMSEFLTLKEQGWNVGFCTLTYSERNMPYIPKVLFKDESKYCKVKCFSKEDVDNLVTNIRQYCKYHYKFKKIRQEDGDSLDNNIRYFVSSEYGSETKRPHYHMIIAWPSTVDYKVMHGLIKKFWLNKDKESLGYVFPRDYRGDLESGCKSFEVVGDPTKALSYVSKYACKDMDFIKEIDGLDLDESKRIYAKIQPFHKQSQCLGFERVKRMTDAEKMEVFTKGISFVGDGESYQIPMYIKNKIMYNNYYVVDENGKRLVKRKASEFFEANREEIYEKKSEFYQKMFSEGQSVKYYTDRGVNQEMAEKFSRVIGKYRNNLSNFIDIDNGNMLGKLYLSYFGVKNSSCFAYESEETRDSDLCEQWMLRYRHPNAINNSDKVVIPSCCYYALQNLCSFVLGCMTFCNISKIGDRENEEIRLNRIRDFYNNVLQRHLEGV